MDSLPDRDTRYERARTKTNPMGWVDFIVARVDGTDVVMRVSICNNNNQARDPELVIRPIREFVK